MNELFRLSVDTERALLLQAASSIPGILTFVYVRYLATFGSWNNGRAGFPIVSAYIIAATTSSILYVGAIVMLFASHGPAITDSPMQFRIFRISAAANCLAWMLGGFFLMAHYTITNRSFRWLICGFVVLYLLVLPFRIDGVSFLSAVGYAYNTIGEFSKDAGGTDVISISSNLISERMLSAAFYCSITYVAGSYIKHIILSRFYLQDSSSGTGTGLSAMMQAFLLLLVVIIAFAVLRIDPIVLGAFSGIVGATLSVIFRNVLRDIFSGIILSFDNSVRKNDFIRTADGSVGLIKEIGLRYAIIQTRDNVDFLIPNSSLVEGRIENFTRSGQEVRLSLPFEVGLDADLNKVRKIALQACRQVPEAGAVTRSASAVFYLGPKAGAHQFDLRFWVVTPERGIDKLRSDVAFAVFSEFIKSGIPLSTK
jgi:small-conductance mechanosensitive channel